MAWPTSLLAILAGVGPGPRPRRRPVAAGPRVPLPVPAGRLPPTRSSPAARSRATDHHAGLAVRAGDQPVPTPARTPSYNFPEVTSYVGILALIAACSLFLRRYRARPEARQWWIWYLIAGVGLLSAFGSQTPFGHVLYLIPRHQRRAADQPQPAAGGLLPGRAGGMVGPLLFDAAGRDTDRPRGWRAPGGRWQAGGRAEIVLTSAPLPSSRLLCLLLGRRRPGAPTPAAAALPVFSTSHPAAGVRCWSRPGRHRRRRPPGSCSSMRPFPSAGSAGCSPRCWWSTWPCSTCSSSARPPPTPRPRPTGRLSASTPAHTGNGRFIIYDPDEIRDRPALPAWARPTSTSSPGCPAARATRR